MKQKNKGITLIALVITIILLLILAGITISELTGNGLFDKVKLAKEKSEQAQIDENETLDDYENKIVQYINSSRNGNENNYSESEIQVGTWIDGSPVYQKTIYFGELPNNTTKQIPVNVENIKYVVSIKGIAFNDSWTNVEPLPYVHDYVNYTILDFRENNIFMSTKCDRSQFKAYVTIQYTKTQNN